MHEVSESKEIKNYNVFLPLSQSVRGVLIKHFVRHLGFSLEKCAQRYCYLI